MAYYIDLFSPETHEAFWNSDRTISGFRMRQQSTANQLKPGDILISYVTRLSRWSGVLEVTSKCFIDHEPRFSESDDPFVVRVKVKTIALLDLEHSLPMENDLVWKRLSFTKNLPKKSLGWTGMVRGSLRRLDDADGAALEHLILDQAKNRMPFPLSDTDHRKLTLPTVKTHDSKQVAVFVPEKDGLETPKAGRGGEEQQKESTRIQALIANIGERMNLKVWLPKADRSRVLKEWTPQEPCLMDSLPLNYDDVTLKTIENIDVLWIKGRSIVRAFEVEHSTSIYSGILRMADLMALQPNLNIKAHIVAPLERKEKVLQEISRPVFALLDRGPLSGQCSYISYDSIRELINEKRLEYMNDSVLEEYAEYAEGGD